MSRFETKFAELAAKKEGAFVPFVTLCDPTFDRSFEIICTLVENGADALELGFPFSDPLLDGPVIQAANNRALNAGHSTEDSFKLLAKVRSKYPEIPIRLLLCANLIFAKGLDNFYQRCAEVGIDAVLVADIPMGAALAIYARENGDGVMFEPEEIYDELNREPTSEQPLSFAEAVDKPKTEKKPQKSASHLRIVD